MDIVFKIEMNEIEKDLLLTHYNNIVWKLLKTNPFGFTHVIEKYDDVNDDPTYFFCIIDKSDKLNRMETGYGDPIIEDDLGFGGRFVSIDMNINSSNWMNRKV